MDVTKLTFTDLDEQIKALEEEKARRKLVEAWEEVKRSRKKYGVLVVCHICEGHGFGYVDFEGDPCGTCEMCDGTGSFYAIRLDKIDAARRDFDCLETCVHHMNKKEFA